MMTSSFKDVDWTDSEDAIPAFFAGIFMALCYSISYGIAFGFISYCIVQICKKEAGKISSHPLGGFGSVHPELHPSGGYLKPVFRRHGAGPVSLSGTGPVLCSRYGIREFGIVREKTSW